MRVFRSATMLPLKWKFYRIANYLLLVSSAFLLLKSFELTIRSSERAFGIYSFSVGLIFILMISQSIINLVIMAKTFPDKLLIHGRSYWHTFATISNALYFFAFFYITVFELLPGIGKVGYPYDKPLIITVSIFLFLLVNSVFVLFCQLTLKRFLQRNNATIITSMIDSIGKE